MSENEENQEKHKSSSKGRHKHDSLSGITGGLILILLGG